MLVRPAAGPFVAVMVPLVRQKLDDAAVIIDQGEAVGRAVLEAGAATEAKPNPSTLSAKIPDKAIGGLPVVLLTP